MKRIFEGKRVMVWEREGWEYVERKKGKEAVVVLAVTDDGRAILTEQYRRPVNGLVIDWPAGLIGDEAGHNDAATTAIKELEEETGYTCRDVQLLARGPTSPGITSEVVSFYRARGVERVGDGGGVRGEAIRVHLVPASGVREWLMLREREGKLIDLKLWGGLYFISP